MVRNYQANNLEIRLCPICDKEYAISKGALNKTCGKVCGAEKRRRTRLLNPRNIRKLKIIKKAD